MTLLKPSRGATSLRLPGTLLLLAAFTSAGCGDDPEPPPEPARPVKILEISDTSSGRTLEFPGQVRAAQEAQMGFEVPGRVIDFPVIEGQQVEEGQLLAKLDPRDFQAQLDAQHARQNQAKTEYDRQKILFSKGVASKQDRERAQRNFEVIDAAVQAAQKAVDDTELRAPFDGVVARKIKQDFKNVQAKEVILILQDLSHLEVVVGVPEADLARGTRNRQAAGVDRERAKPIVVLSTFPDKPIPATIKEIATTADPTTRTFAVTVRFDTPTEFTVLPGMTAKVSVKIPGSRWGGSGVSIPSLAVRSDDEGNAMVWKVDAQTLTVSKALVELGELSGDQVEIQSGLSNGDQIAISGVHHLREGMQVLRYEN